MLMNAAGEIMSNTLKLLSRWTVVLASLEILAACAPTVSDPIASDAPDVLVSNNSVLATSTTSFSVVVGSSTTVSMTFTTDDGMPAKNLAITSGSSTLPDGWSGPTTFTCASVSTGSGCMLSLTYRPMTAGSGSLTVYYSYTNNAGADKTGTATVSYTATTNDNVVATPSPAGQIAVITSGKTTVGVTFTTDDGQPATKLSITSGLAALPAGWSGPSTFTCASVSTGNSCQLSLAYSPTTGGVSGTLQLMYGYNDDSGNAKTGSVSIAYVSTTHDNLIATVSPSGSINAMVNSGSVPVTLTFTTDDGNPATGITITSGLSTLPAGWSGPVTFSCSSASMGTGCQLALTYAPTVNGSGTVALGYGYKDDSGTAKTGTANIAYASVPGSLYLPDTSSNIVRCALSGVDGSLHSCASVASGLSAPLAIAFSGNWAYVTPGSARADVDVCPVNADGTLGTCTNAHTFSIPLGITVRGGYLYVADADGPDFVYSCTINSADGSLSACTANPIGTVNTLDGIAVTATHAYVVDYNGEHLSTCTVNPADGTLSGCIETTLIGTDPAGGNTPHAYPRSASIYGGNLYIGTLAGILVLPIASNGSVTVNYPCSTTTGTSCTIESSGPGQTEVSGFAFSNGYAYFGGYGIDPGGGVGICTIEASGLLEQCVISLELKGSAYYGAMAVH
jgi:hypothetical protein